MRSPRSSIQLAFAWLLAIQGLLAAQAPENDTRTAYVQALDQLRSLVDSRRASIARLTRLKGIADYLKERLRDPELDADDKKAMKAELDGLEDQALAQSSYLKSSASYGKEIEKYLDTLKTTSPDVSDWEKSRRSLWKNGEPFVTIVAMPPSPVALGQDVLLEAVGVPPGARVIWTATRGTIAPRPAPESGALATWVLDTAQGDGGPVATVIRAEILHPKIRYPESLSVTFEIDENAGKPTSENARQFVGSLANLLNSELGIEQARVELASTEEQIDQLRSEDPPPADLDAELVRLRTEKENLEARIESLASWIAYIDRYELPALAEADSSIHRWELERQDILTRYGGLKRRWPWLVRAVEATTPDRWRFSVSDLPEGTTTTWRISHADGSQRDVDAAGPAEVEIAVDRPESEVLSAYVVLPIYDLPLRLDWYLPATTK